MIEVRDVTKSYGRKASAFQALRGVSFAVPLGATVAIIGKSGSGKSTLMHLMGGLDRPTAGDILINDRSLGSLNRKAMDRFRSRDLGFVFQAFFIEANQSCYQNVVLPLEIAGVPRRKRKALVERALEQVGLYDKIGAKAGTLSGGQKQRLAIARAIVNEPKLIMADEPTGNLDSANGDKVMDLLFGLNRRLKSTLVIITHDDELAARCQYRISLKDGKVVSVAGPGSTPVGAARPASGVPAPTVAPVKARTSGAPGKPAMPSAPRKKRLVI